jgi:hypothetical protein
MMNLLFWCEFPERMNWEDLNSFFISHSFTAKIGVACTSRQDFEEKKKSIEKYSNLNIAMAWPVLSKENGYWFSSQTERKDIDSLDQYKGMKIKLDIEPRIPNISSYKNNSFALYLWLFKQLFMKGKNQQYLQEKITELSKTTDIMLSTFPFPDTILISLGMVFDKNMKYNYIFYSSFFPKPLRMLYRIYMHFFIKRKLKFSPETFFAAGLLTPGIFNDEPAYKNPGELEKDIKFLLKNNAKNIIIFQLNSFQELKNPSDWLYTIKKYL